ncbi:MAG: class I SAM-dependent methyltransferase [Candidatus Aminicenantia bacterium]
MELKDLRDYYNNIYYDSDKKYSRRVEDYKVFLDYLHPEKDSKLLDVSCGPGLLLKAAEKYYNCQTYGIELSEKAVLEAKNNTKFSKLQIADGEVLPYRNNTFDYVTSIGSLEHYINPEKGLDEIIRVCKPGGKICIVLPNYYYLLNILNVFLKGDHYIGHRQINERVDTLKGWLRFLKKEGLIIEKIYQDKGGKQPPIFEYLNPVKIIKRIFKKLLLALTPLNLTYQFVFICRRTKLNKELKKLNESV